jgi:hypothetical protein
MLLSSRSYEVDGLTIDIIALGKLRNPALQKNSSQD